MEGSVDACGMAENSVVADDVSAPSSSLFVTSSGRMYRRKNDSCERSITEKNVD